MRGLELLTLCLMLSASTRFVSAQTCDLTTGSDGSYSEDLANNKVRRITTTGCPTHASARMNPNDAEVQTVAQFRIPLYPRINDADQSLQTAGGTVGGYFFPALLQ